jgi:uncharacterized coiled-coil DUF342 family protein
MPDPEVVQLRNEMSQLKSRIDKLEKENRDLREITRGINRVIGVETSWDIPQLSGKPLVKRLDEIESQLPKP